MFFFVFSWSISDFNVKIENKTFYMYVYKLHILNTLFEYDYANCLCKFCEIIQ